MSCEEPDPLLDWSWTVALAAAGLVLRSAFAAQRLYHRDSVPLALAIEHFDVRLHQPPPLGCFYYVLLAGWAARWTGDPARGMSLLSALFGGLVAGALYRLGREMGGARIGRAAGVLALTAPLLLFDGAVQGIGSVDLFWSTMAALFCYRLIRDKTNPSDLVGAAAALGVAGGVRALTLILLLPMAMLAAWRSRHDPRALTIAAGVLASLTLGWLVPVVALSGDWPGYLATIRADLAEWAETAFRMLDGQALAAAIRLHARSVVGLLGPLGCGVTFLALGSRLLARCARGARCPVPGAQPEPGSAANHLGPSVRRLPWFRAGGRAPGTGHRAALFLLLWGLPLAFFEPLFGAAPTAHTAAYAGALVIATAMALAFLDDRISVRGVSTGILAAVALTSLVVFAGFPGRSRGASPGPGSLYSSEIRSHDRYWRDFPAVAGGSAPPGQVLILVPPTPTDGLLIARYYLPEYRRDIRQPVADGASLQLPYPAEHDPGATLSRAAILADPRPKLCVVRTPSDVAFFRGLFGDALKLTREGEIQGIRDTRRRLTRR